MTLDPPLDPQKLFETHHFFVSRLARAMVADEHMAEDLAHDTWVEVVRRPPAGVRDQRAWLATVLRRRVASYRRRVRKGDPIESVDAASTLAAADEAAQQLEYEHVLHAAVRSLGEPYRTTVYLRFHEGLAPRDIAARAGIPVKTVKTRLSRALAKLRTTLDAEFGNPACPRRDWRLALVPFGTAVPLSRSTLPLLLSMKKLIAVAALLLASVGWLSLRALSVDPKPVTSAVAAKHEPMVHDGPERLGPELVALDGPVTREEIRPEKRPTGRPSELASAPATGDTTIIVELRATTGAPIADRPIVLKPSPWANAGEPPVVLRTNKAGRAVFSELAGSHYLVSDGRGGKAEQVEVARGKTANLEWVLTGDLIVRGRVVDENGQPVAGAGIWSAAFSAPDMPMSRTARTGSDGGFVLSCSPGAALQATSRARIPSALEYVQILAEIEPGVRWVTFTLGASGSSLRGRVLDSGGDPIQGATVVVGPEAWPDRGNTDRRNPRPTLAISGHDGRFETPFSYPVGEHPVVVRAAGFAATATTVQVGGAPANVEFVLYRGVDVSGIVLRPNGTPASRAHVWVASPGSKWQAYGKGLSASAQCDEAGRFMLRSVSAGQFAIRARAGWAEELTRGAQTVEVTESPTRDLQLQLEVGRTISGRTVDSDGTGVQGLVVTAFCPPAKSNDVVTAADGSFQITSLPDPEASADEWELVVRAWTGATTRTLATRGGLAPNREPVDLVVERIEEASGRIIGRIVADYGRVPGDVQARLGEEGHAGDTALRYDQDTGAFSTRLLRPGTYQIELSRGGVPLTATSGLVVGPGETIDAGVIRLDGDG